MKNHLSGGAVEPLVADRSQFMNARNGQTSVSDAKANSLGRTRPDVAGGENPRDSGFQRARLTILQRPTSRSQRIDSRQDIPQLIARDFFRQPRTSRLGPDENKNSADGQIFGRTT